MKQQRFPVARVTLASLSAGPLALARSLGPDRRRRVELAARLSLSSREREFARSLLERKSNWRLFRSHQAGFGGDFVVVDMSAPQPEWRLVWVVELKAGEEPRVVSSTRHQLRRAVAIVAAVSALSPVIPPAARFEAVIGDPTAVCRWLAGHPASSWKV